MYFKLISSSLRSSFPPFPIPCTVRCLHLLLPENVVPLLVFCHYTPVCTITALGSLQTISLFCPSQISQDTVQCLCIIKVLIDKGLDSFLIVAVTETSVFLFSDQQPQPCTFCERPKLIPDEIVASQVDFPLSLYSPCGKTLRKA